MTPPSHLRQKNTIVSSNQTRLPSAPSCCSSSARCSGGAASPPNACLMQQNPGHHPGRAPLFKRWSNLEAWYQDVPFFLSNVPAHFVQTPSRLSETVENSFTVSIPETATNPRDSGDRDLLFPCYIGFFDASRRLGSDCSLEALLFAERASQARRQPSLTCKRGD